MRATAIGEDRLQRYELCRDAGGDSENLHQPLCASQVMIAYDIRWLWAVSTTVNFWTRHGTGIYGSVRS